MMDAFSASGANRSVSLDGFSLHAGVRVHANDRQGLERLRLRLTPSTPSTPRTHAGVPPHPAGAGSTPVATGEAPAPDAPNRFALEGLEAPERRGEPDLRLRWSSVPHDPDAPGGGAGGGGDAGATATPGAVMAEWLREQSGRARVETGLVHSYYSDIGKALLRAWNVDGTIKKHGLPGYVTQLGENFAAFGRVWQKLAEGYGKTGAPALLDGGSPRMKELSGLPPGPARDSLVQAEIGRKLRAEFSKGRVTLVRVTQAADGRLLSVELVSPSIDPAIDRAAIEGVREAAQNLPEPPDEARASRYKLVSLWEFQLEVSISPPIPLIEFQFDEMVGVTDARLPLDRRVWKQISLVAVY